MSSYKIEGIVLHYQDFGEADRLITVYSKYHGKRRLLAKGVRRINSRKSGSIELLNHAYFFIVEGRNLDLITEVSVEQTFQGLKTDLKIAAELYIILELVSSLTAEEQPNSNIFGLLLETLELLLRKKDDQDKRSLLTSSFELKLLKESGFWETAAIISKYKPAEEVIQIIYQLERLTLREIAETEIPQPAWQKAYSIIENQRQWVLEKELKAKRFMKDVMKLENKTVVGKVDKKEN